MSFIPLLFSKQPLDYNPKELFYLLLIVGSSLNVVAIELHQSQGEDRVEEHPKILIKLLG